MPNMRQIGQQDGRMLRDGLRELTNVFEERVILRVWTGAAGGDPQAGIADTDIYTTIPTRANVSDVTAQDVFMSGGVFQAGDIKIELRRPIHGASSQAGQDGQIAGRKSDLIIYRGYTWWIVGKTQQIHEAGRVLWMATMRTKGA